MKRLNLFTNWRRKLEMGYRYFPTIGWKKMIDKSKNPKIYYLKAGSKTVAAIFLFFALAHSEQKILVDSLRVPWINASGMIISQGTATQLLRPWYQLQFRSGGWNTPIYLDTLGMDGGGLHFLCRFTKANRTIAVWLSGDDSGMIVAKTFKSDTSWQSINMLWSTLNPKGRKVNVVTLQNNGGDSNSISIKDVRFITREPSFITLPSPPKIDLRFLNEGDTITGNLICGAVIHDSLPIVAVSVVLDGFILSDTSFYPYRIIYSDIGRNGTVFYHFMTSTDRMIDGKHVLWIKASNWTSSFEMPVTFFVKHISGITLMDSLRISRQAIAQIPDSLKVYVPKPSY